MKIYIVVKLDQSYDSDGWQYWVEKSNISYHKTLQGAEQFRTEQLAIYAKRTLDGIQLNPHLPATEFEEKSRLILENKQQLVDGTQSDHPEEYEVLRIEVIELKA